MTMIRRKRELEEHDNPERWLVSYADFITLLFAFFVVMYAISSVNQKKYKKLSESINSAFTNTPMVVSKQPDSLGSKPSSKGESLVKPLPLTQLHSQKLQIERENMTRLGINLSNSLSPLVKDEKIRVVQNNRGIRIDINDNLLFASGSADLNPGANSVLSQIANLLLQDDHAVQVEGHTDNTPIHSAQFYSNWELSAVRASSVVRMLSTLGVEENRLSALGFGSTQPISTNDSPEERAKDRRVSIMILYDRLNASNDTGIEITPRNPA